jgi:putative spermidine/putrescine transport system ATP-binding protein
VVERDGRRFSVRPEKVRILESAGGEQGMHTEGGVIRDVAYAGMVTRYLVALDGGGELQVVRQNLETSSSEVLEQRGRAVTVGWRPDQTVAVQADTRRETPSERTTS